MKNELILVYVTCANGKEAERIGRALVDFRLAACVNFPGSIRSIYRWRNTVNKAREVVLIAKTRRTLLKKLTAKVISMHSYECPCVVALPIEGGNADFLKWIADETVPD